MFTREHEKKLEPAALRQQAPAMAWFIFRSGLQWQAPPSGLAETVLFRALGHDELAVQAGDVAQRNVLGAFGGACTGVGAVTESEFVHLPDHCAGTACAFHLTLRQECELAYLSADK